MKEKSFNFISVIVISLLISSNIYSDDIKINKKLSEKNYRIQELKTNFFKTETKIVPVFVTESNGMTKGVSTWVGAGAGLIVGTLTGYIIGTGAPSGGSRETIPPEFGGAVIGGFAGLIIGGVTGYILGK